DSRNAGARTLALSGIVNDGNSGNNYSYTFNTASGTISKAALTILAATDSKTYNGTTTSSVTPTFGSLQMGDTTTTFSQALSAVAITLNPFAGTVVLHGPPSAAGIETFKVNVKDSAGATLMQAFTIAINSALSISNRRLSRGRKTRPA